MSRKTWKIADIASQAGLSESRVLHLYREFFDVSPIDDLIAYFSRVF